MASALGDRYLVTAGSIAGREHARLHRNNQDAVAIHAADGVIAAAVTDGCSSSRWSEVGARLGALFLARRAASLAAHTAVEELPCAVARDLADYLAAVANGVAGSAAPAPEVVGDLLLFTFLVVVLTSETTTVFGQGDGVVSINGRVAVVDSGPDNAPDYLAYRLVPSAVCRPGPRTQDPVVHHLGPTRDLDTVVLGTDGLAELEDRRSDVLPDGRPVGGVDQFETEPRYLANPTLVQKRLAAVGAVHGRLHDDTTLVLVRRRTML